MADSKLVVLKGEPEDKHLAYAEVYAPNRPDSDGEYMDEETILKMAHNFARTQRLDQIDVEHDGKVRPGVCVVESFIARKSDPDFLPGSWVVGVHIPDNDLWEQVKSGEINGFSVEALVHKSPEEVEMEVPPVITGNTNEASGHVHKFYVSYDQNGEFIGGVTDDAGGHSHKILRGTVTEEVDGHTHRFSSVDLLNMVAKS